MPEPTERLTPGNIAYGGYAAQMGWTTFDGRRMPAWKHLPANVRAGWETAARMVRRQALTDVQEMLRAEHARMTTEAAS